MINYLYNLHTAKKINISLYHGENEFYRNSLQEHISPSSLNICTQGLHITIIKQSIQTIKQGARCTIKYIQCKKYTKLMKIPFVSCIILSKNTFSRKGSISKRLGGNKTLSGNPKPYINKKIILFGCYDMLYR